MHYSDGGDFDQAFGERLRKYRDQRDWTQRRLAEELRLHGVKLDPSAVTRIELGSREVKLREAFAIASVLGIDIRDLIAEVDPQYQLHSLGSSIAAKVSSARDYLGSVIQNYVEISILLDANPRLLNDLRLSRIRDLGGDPRHVGPATEWNVNAFLAGEVSWAAMLATPVTRFPDTIEGARAELILAVVQAAATANLAINARPSDETAK